MPKTAEKREPRPKKKKNESLELLRAITKSMAGAIPGLSEETNEVVEDSLARPLSGMASQILGEDPTEPGKLVFPPLHNLKRAWNADARRKAGQEPEKMAMPGLIQDSLSLPAVFGGGPQWAQDASASADRIHAAVDEGMDLAPPQGFRQHALNSAGMMASQIPVAGKSKEAAEIGKGALHIFKKYGKKALTSPIEFFSPTIEPKMSNYLLGSAAGGGLGALGDEAAGAGGEVVEEMPPPRAVSRAKGGKVGALQEILRAVSMNPDATAKQTQHVIGDPIEEVLHAANEGERKGVIDAAEGQRIRFLIDSGDEDSLADALISLQKKLFPTPSIAPTGRRVVTSVAAPQGPGKLPEVESDVPLLEPAPHVTEVPNVPPRVRPAEAPAGHGLRDEASRRPPDQGEVPDSDWAKIRNRMKGWKVQSVFDLEELLPTQTTEEMTVKIPPMGKWTNWPDDPKARPKKLNILKNPKSQEDVIRWAGRDVDKVRFMTTQDGDTYVWDADEAIHNQVLEALGLSRKGLFHEMTDTPIPPRMFDQFFFENPWE